VTRRETGSWRWAAFQFAYMTVLAYTAALLTFQTLSRLGLG
jgi:ferrous iron transport protein B